MPCKSPIVACLPFIDEVFPVGLTDYLGGVAILVERSVLLEHLPIQRLLQTQTFRDKDRASFLALACHLTLLTQHYLLLTENKNFSSTVAILCRNGSGVMQYVE